MCNIERKRIEKIIRRLRVRMFDFPEPVQWKISNRIQQLKEQLGIVVVNCNTKPRHYTDSF